MKEIIDRLNENRQIEVAKSVLESNGYRVYKKTLRESNNMTWGNWEKPSGSLPEKYYSDGNIVNKIVGVIYYNDPTNGDPDFAEGYTAEIYDDSITSVIEDFDYGTYDTEEEAKEQVENWFEEHSSNI